MLMNNLQSWNPDCILNQRPGADLGGFRVQLKPISYEIKKKKSDIITPKNAGNPISKDLNF